MAVYDFRIGSGWNVPIGSLVNVENLPRQGGYRWMPPAIVPSYNWGVEKFTGDGGDYFSGAPMVPWHMKIRQPNWYYLYNTIGGGLVRSKVTIYTLLKAGNSTYYRMNAYMYLPEPQRSETDFSLIPNYTAFMTRLVASS